MDRSRVPFALGALVAVACLAAGCGSGGTSASGAGPRSAGAANPSSIAHAHAKPRISRPVTRSQAMAFAHAVNLTVADIQGAKASPPKQRSREPARCGAPGHEHESLDVRAPWFKRGSALEGEEISSDVTTWSSARFAVRAIAVARSASARACAERILRERFAGKNERRGSVGQIRVTFLPVHAPGADATAGTRVEITFMTKYSEVPLPYYSDILGFAWGPDVIQLVANSYTQPVPAATEEQLLARLLARAKAHTL
jgi:hypothetical protein